MELNIARISKSEGIKEHFSFAESFNDRTIDFSGEKLELLSPVEVSGSAVNYEGKINVEVNIAAKVQRICSRCLEPFAEDVNVSSGYVFIREAANWKEDYYVYKGDKIDLAELVLGDIAAALTMKPLCRDDCKGLCPLCGKNKNMNDCECRSEQIDSRLQALSKLLDEE